MREWAAHIILAIEYLHSHGIICRSVSCSTYHYSFSSFYRDLNPANILLSDSGKLYYAYYAYYVTATLFHCSGKALLTYFGKWDFVEANSKFKLSQQLYTSPGESPFCS